MYCYSSQVESFFFCMMLLSVLPSIQMLMTCLFVNSKRMRKACLNSQALAAGSLYREIHKPPDWLHAHEQVVSAHGHSPIP